MPTSSPLLRCHDLSCGYQNRKILESLTFSIQPGEVVGLLGCNGSGKSTLLKTISKTLLQLSGEIWLGDDLQEELTHRQCAKKIAFVPQETNFVYEHTVQQIVLMGRLAHSKRIFETHEDHLIVNKALYEVGCEQFAKKSITELSGGERQRVLIARALAQQARLLILDEPISQLDIKYQLSIAELITRLAREGYGVLISLHDLNWASVMTNRLIVLDQRKIALQGTTHEVLNSSKLSDCYDVEFSRIYDENQFQRIFANFSRDKQKADEPYTDKKGLISK